MKTSGLIRFCFSLSLEALVIKSHLETSDSLVLPELFSILVPAQRGNGDPDGLAS